MLLQDVIDDIHALYKDLKVYERKYGILSETFYELARNLKMTTGCAGNFFKIALSGVKWPF